MRCWPGTWPSVEHLSLRVGGELLREKYRKFFGNEGKPIRYMSDGIPFTIRIVDVGVYAQTISAAISDARIYNEMLQSSRSYIVDIGGGTTNVISIIDRKPQNPGITLEEMGVLELFKLAHRTIMEDCGRNIDDFMIDVLMQGKKSCPDAMKASIERAKNEFVKKLILELEARKVDLYMGYICMVGGGSVLLFDAFHRYITEKGNNDIVLIPDVKANARGYYAQEMARLASAVLRSIVARPRRKPPGTERRRLNLNFDMGVKSEAAAYTYLKKLSANRRRLVM